MPSIWTIVLGLGTAYAVAMAVVIVLQRRSAAATIAWLMVLVFLPIIGIGIYRFIGPLRLTKKKTRIRRTRQLVAEALGAIASLEAASTHHEETELARVGFRAGEAPPLPADSIDLYVDGQSCYAAIVAAIEEAKHHVHLEYYIWEPDHFGCRLLELLERRARAGIHVRLLLDAVGSMRLHHRHLKKLRDAGVEVAWFNPVSLRTLRGRRADFRTHRKIVVCDGRVGFTGGMNITDVHTAEFSGDRAWRDTHLRLVGSAVRPLQRTFVDDWYFATERLPAAGPEYFPPVDAEPGKHIVQVVTSGPDGTIFPIHRAFFTAINTAAEKLYVTTPYFIPDEAILTALVTAGLRGLDVRLLIPRRGDSRLIDLAARSYLLELLEAGVRVFEYHRFVHAKTMAIDDRIAVVGTANLDNRSFRLNFEVAALVYDKPIATTLANAFLTDLQTANEFQAADLRDSPFLSRFGQAGARLLSPLL